METNDGYMGKGNLMIKMDFELLETRKLTAWKYKMNDMILLSLDEFVLEYSHILLPNEIKLYPPYPNPFNPQTQISFSVDKTIFISINIYDINGRLVKNIHNEKTSAGYHQLIWNSDNISSGIYFVVLQSEDKVKTHKLMLMK